MSASTLLCPCLQAKSSSECHPHGHILREEEKCMKDLLLLNSYQATGE